MAKYDIYKPFGILDDIVENISENTDLHDVNEKAMLYSESKFDIFLEEMDITSCETEKNICFGNAIKNETELRTQCSNQIQIFTKEELLNILKSVCNFVGDTAQFDFTLTERQNAILIVDKQFMVTKVCNKENSEFRTIIEYNGEKYICFKILGDINIHCISIPADMTIDRKYLIIEDNPDINFNLKNCEV